MRAFCRSALCLLTACVMVCGMLPAADAENSRPGATPIPIYPVDMPSPTPVPELSFNYQAYETSAMGLKFEGPVGWTVSEDSGMYLLTEPDSEAKNGFNTTVMLVSTNVTSTLKGSSLRTELKDTILTLKASQYLSLDYAIAERTLLDADGYYANCNGQLTSGEYTYVYMLMTCLDKSVIRIQLTCPSEYKNSYSKLMQRMRNTLKWIAEE